MSTITNEFSMFGMKVTNWREFADALGIVSFLGNGYISFFGLFMALVAFGAPRNMKQGSASVGGVHAMAAIVSFVIWVCSGSNKQYLNVASCVALLGTFTGAACLDWYAVKKINEKDAKNH